MLAVVARYCPTSWAMPSSRGTSRALASTLKIPVLTKFWNRSGEPMTTSFCPGTSRALSPKARVLGAVTPCTRSSAMSMPGSTASTRAVACRPLESVTVMASWSCTTW